MFTRLLNDRDIACSLSVSTSWVRKQRFLRRKGEAHMLTVDPVLIGSSPRYRQDEIETWIESLGEKR